MSVASFVLVCALDLLGRSADRLPPIILLEARPAEASLEAVGFVRRGERVIYLITSSGLFREAMDVNRARDGCRNLDLLRFVASVIVHEAWHVANGSDEEGAYLAQLTEMQRLGAGPGRWPFEAVRRAMVATRARQQERLRLAQQQAALADGHGPRDGPDLDIALSADRLWPRAAQGSTPLPGPPR